MKTWQDLKVGDTVWLYVSDWRSRPGAWDRKVTREAEDAFRADERNAWVPRKVEGETSVSWIIKGDKYPKKKRPSHGDDYRYPLVLISAEEIDDAVFVAYNAREVAHRVERITQGPGGADALRAIARELREIGVEVRLREDDKSHRVVVSSAQPTKGE